MFPFIRDTLCDRLTFGSPLFLVRLPVGPAPSGGKLLTSRYTKLAERLGLLTPTWLFPPLSHLAEWCLHEGLAPLTSLAIAEDTGMPGPGHPLPRESIAAQQNRARKFDWYAVLPPALADLEGTGLQAAE